MHTIFTLHGSEPRTQLSILSKTKNKVITTSQLHDNTRTTTYSAMPIPTVPTGASTIIEAPLGRSSQQIQISLLSFPAVTAPPETKAQAFDFCMDTLSQHRTSFEFAELSSFITSHVPCSDGSAFNQAAQLGAEMRAAVFSVQNLRGRGFHDHTTRQIADDELEKTPSKRPSGIAFVTIEATIDPAQHLLRDTTLGTLRPLVFIYSLALPQEEIMIPNGRDNKDEDKDPFDTPPRKIKITELESNTDGALIAGTKNGTDVLEDYEEDVIALPSSA